MTTMNYQQTKDLIDQLMLQHYGPAPGTPPAAETIVDPAADAQLDQEYAADELALVAEALSQHDDGKFHTLYLRGAKDVDSLLRGDHGQYAANVMQGILHTLAQGENYITTPEAASQFVAQEVQRMTEILDDRRLTPQEMHDPEGSARAIEADRERLRDGTELFSDERAHAAAQTFEASLAQSSGMSVDAMARSEAQAWNAKDQRISGPNDPSFVETLRASGGANDAIDDDAVAATMQASVEELARQQAALPEPDTAGIDALAPAGPSEEMQRAAEMDRARAGISAHPPEAAMSRAAEAERWAGLLRSSGGGSSA